MFLYYKTLHTASWCLLQQFQGFSQFYPLKSVLSNNFSLSRTMTVVAKNSLINNYFSFQSLLLLQCIFIRLLLSINRILNQIKLCNDRLRGSTISSISAFL